MMSKEIQEQSQIEITHKKFNWAKLGTAIGGLALCGGFVAFGLGIAKNINENDNYKPDTNSAVHTTQNAEGFELMTGGLVAATLGLGTTMVFINHIPGRGQKDVQ